jgi:hypothetical protein
MRVGLMSYQREKQGPLHVTAGVKKDGETLPPGNGSQCINSCSTIKNKEMTDGVFGHMISSHNYAAIIDPRLLPPFCLPGWKVSIIIEPMSLPRLGGQLYVITPNHKRN